MSLEVDALIGGCGYGAGQLESFVGGAVLPAELNVAFPVEHAIFGTFDLGDVQAGRPIGMLFGIGTLFIQHLGEGLVCRFVEILSVAVADQGCFETYLHDDFPS